MKNKTTLSATLLLTLFLTLGLFSCGDEFAGLNSADSSGFASDKDATNKSKTGGLETQLQSETSYETLPQENEVPPEPILQEYATIVLYLKGTGVIENAEGEKLFYDVTGSEYFDNIFSGDMEIEYSVPMASGLAKAFISTQNSESFRAYTDYGEIQIGVLSGYAKEDVEYIIQCSSENPIEINFIMKDNSVIIRGENINYTTIVTDIISPIDEIEYLLTPYVSSVRVNSIVNGEVTFSTNENGSYVKGAEKIDIEIYGSQAFDDYYFGSNPVTLTVNVPEGFDRIRIEDFLPSIDSVIEAQKKKYS